MKVPKRFIVSTSDWSYHPRGSTWIFDKYTKSDSYFSFLPSKKYLFFLRDKNLSNRLSLHPYDLERALSEERIIPF